MHLQVSDFKQEIQEGFSSKHSWHLKNGKWALGRLVWFIYSYKPDFYLYKYDASLKTAVRVVRKWLPTLEPTSRLLARILFTWDSAISARSSASSSSCCSLRNLLRWVLACSSCRVEQSTGKSNSETLAWAWMMFEKVKHSQPPQLLSCRLWLWAAVCPPGPGGAGCSSDLPQSDSTRNVCAINYSCPFIF